MTERKRKSIKNIENRETAAPEVNAMNTASEAIMENAASVLNEARMHSPQLEHIMLTLIWAGERAGHCGNCGRTEKVQVKEKEGAESRSPVIKHESMEINEQEDRAADIAEGTANYSEPEVVESAADVNEDAEILPTDTEPETETTESTEPDTEPETDPENTIEMEEFRRRRSKRNQYWSHNRTYWLRGAEAKLEKVFPMCSIASRQEFICKLQLVPGLLEYCCAAIYDHFGSEPFSMIMAAQKSEQAAAALAAETAADAEARRAGIEACIGDAAARSSAQAAAGSSDDAANALSLEDADASAARREEGSR